MDGKDEKPRLSVAIPVFNEAENLLIFHQQLKDVLLSLQGDFEICYVDDGSTDSSYRVLQGIAMKDERVTVVRFVRNFGQTLAMSAGVNLTQGEVLVFLDADLQNDPEDIVRMLEKIEEGYDVVCGWRKERQDNCLLRIFPSLVANKLISWITGVHLRDYGCTVKAFRREIISGISFYGEIHRFLPALASYLGASIVEIPVNHRPRMHGKSKYGMGRIGRVLLDLLLVKFLGTFMGNPIKLFGGIGLWFLLLSSVTAVAMLFQKLFYGISLIRTPLLLLSAILLTLGVLSIMMGLLAEVIVRSYYASQQTPPYLIKTVLKGKQELPIPLFSSNCP